MTSALLDAGASRERVLGAMGLASGLGEVDVGVFEDCRDGVRCLRVEVDNADDSVRSLDDVLGFLGGLELPQEVLSTAEGVFERVGRAEERVHGDTVFHRVGAADGVADVLGASAAYHDLGLSDASVAVGPVCVGGGRTAEGYPVPGPATLEILSEAGLEWCGGPSETELLTPTGAALLAELCDRSVRFPPSTVTEGIGVGGGSKELKRPNVMRVFLGEFRELSPDQLCFLETAVDDATGEEVSFTVKRLLSEGALDASVIPMGMKKGRTGYLVRVAARPGDASSLSGVLVDELGTLGVRQYPVEHRHLVERKVEGVEVVLGGEKEMVEVKVAKGPSGVIDVSAEYDDCEELAEKHGIPLRRVMRIAEEAAR